MRGLRLARWFRLVRRAWTVMAVLLVPPLLMGAGMPTGQAPLPTAAGVRGAVVRLADLVTGQSPPKSAVPVQQSGRAPGPQHQVPTAVTRAVARAIGHAPGKESGQAPPYVFPAAKVKRDVTGPADLGNADSFSPVTSKLVASGSTAASKLYRNADGSYTRMEYSKQPGAVQGRLSFPSVSGVGVTGTHVTSVALRVPQSWTGKCPSSAAVSVADSAGANVGRWTGMPPAADCGSSAQGGSVTVPLTGEGEAEVRSAVGASLTVTASAPGGTQATPTAAVPTASAVPASGSAEPSSAAPTAGPSTATATATPSTTPAAPTAASGTATPAAPGTGSAAPASSSAPPTALPSTGTAVSSTPTAAPSTAVPSTAATGSATPAAPATVATGTVLMVTAATATAPQVNDQWPANGYNSPTLTPELIAAATSSDGGTLAFAFYVYDTNGGTVASATGVTTPDWYVPSGKLTWGQTYYWTAVVSEGGLSSQAQAFALSTPVPQPLIYSGLAQNTTGPGYDQQNGNYTTQATDASVTVTGPSLSIQRSYNSADPRQSGAFGAGWSSVLDMKVAPGQPAGDGTTATEVVTYPDGQQVAFGLNADGKTYSSPQGRYSNFTAVSTGGFRLTDKSDTTYLFTQSLGGGAYGITSITDALGHALNFTYNGSGEISQMTSAVSSRSLYLTWQAASGTQLYPHVSTVVTDQATVGTPSTAITWQYAYNGDRLSTSCNESESGIPCTSYTYESGSDYPPAVLDSGPQSYWRLDESSGATAASSVLTNEGTDNGTYINTNGLGSTTGPLVGDSTVSAVTFGSGGYVQVPRSLADEAANMSVSLWFNATAGSDVLFSESQDPITSATTAHAYAPVLYIGSDGHLLGGFNAPGAPLESTAAVDDGHWHNVVLTSAGSVQYLYVDGVQVASKTSTVAPFIQPNIYIGAGFLGGSYPDEANSGVTSTPTFYSGAMSDVASWDRPLTATEVSSLYSAGTHAAAWATKVTQPAGNVSSQVAYDYPTSRVTSVTDANGGVWTLSAPSVSGSSQGYAAAVRARDPEDYWRLGDTNTTSAVNQVHGQDATYNVVTQGATPGPFSDSTVDNFNGSTSYIALPNSLVTPGNQSISLWFNAPVGSGEEVLFSSSVDSPANGDTSNGFTPNLYVGSDGNLNGEFDDDDSPIITTTPVTDGKWHNVILTADNSAGTESMYLDGKLVQTTTGETITGGTAEGQDQVFVGTGFLGADWADQDHYSTTDPTGYPSYFTGDISDVAVYGHPLTAADVAAEWTAAQHSPGMTPVETVTVTQPTSSAVTQAGTGTETYRYDPDNGGRLLSHTDALGDTTSYGYDTNGFQDQVTDPNGNVTTTGHDPRGNTVSKSTCQDQAAGKCSTSYYTFYPDDTETSLSPDPRDDLMRTSRDPRSASATDNTYLTQYTYNTAGEVTTMNTPPVPGSPAAGPATDYYYTDGTTTAGDADGTTIAPKGLLYKMVTPGGAVTQTLYDQYGNVVETINPNDLVTKYGYDNLGRKTTQTVYPDDTLYPNGLTTSYSYDASGNVTQETNPGVTDQVTGDVRTAQTTTTYDKDGSVSQQVTADTTGKDASRTVSYTYNSHEQKSSSTDPVGAVTGYTYDPYGNLASETDPNPSTGAATGNVTGYSYDANGDVLTSTLQNYNGSLADFPTAGPLVIESKAYDPAGRLSSVTDAEGRKTSYGYTDNGMVATTTISDPKTGGNYVQEADTFDAAGNISSRITNNGGTATYYSVDAGDQVTAQQVDPGSLNRITSFGYDPDDHVTGETVAQGGNSPIQTTSSDYDAMGNLKSQTVDDPGAGGPAGWWTLNQGSGTTVRDTSGTGNLATASGVTWTGANGAKLTGQSGQKITTRGPVVDTTGSFSVSAWVKLAAITGSDEQVLSQDAGSMSGFYLGINGGSQSWGFARPEEDENDPPDWAVANGPTAQTGTWTFLTGVYNVNTGTVQLYVNGTASGSASDTAPIAASGPLEIGAEKWDGQAGIGSFDGSIAAVEVYPTALSADEVGNLYQQASGTTTSTPNFGGDITRDGLTTTYQLDKLGQVTAKTNPDGVTTTYTYDEAGRQATVNEPQIAVEDGTGGTPSVAKITTATGYDTFGDVIETRDENGNTTDYAYDLDGRPTSETLPPYTPPSGSGSITAPSKTTYDYLGQVTKATDPLGNATTHSYDQLGDQVSQLDPDTTVPLTATYDGDGEPLSMTDATGAKTTATYDYLGRQVTATQVERNPTDGSTAPVSYTTTTSYAQSATDPGGTWPSQVKSPDGVVTTSRYNAVGEVTQSTDGAGNATTYNYDVLGRQVQTTNPDGTYDTVTYDPVGNKVAQASYSAPPSGSTTGTLLASTTAAYDGEGDQLSATDARGNTTTFTYDPAGDQTAETQPVTDSTGIVTSFGYDAAGNQTRYTNGNGNNWLTTYTTWNQAHTQVEPAAGQYTTTADTTTTVGYDADGRESTVTQPGGVTLTDTYDSMGDLMTQTGSGATATTANRSFTYDANGNMKTAAATAAGSSPATSESFTYDDRGNLVSAAGAAGSTTVSWNGDSETTAVIDAAGKTTYGYDSAGRLSTMGDPASGTSIGYNYNNMDLLSHATYGTGGNVRTYGYNSLHELTSDTLATPGGTTIASVGYGYNADGQLTSKNTTSHTGSTTASAANTYGYDEAGRMTSWNNGTTTTAYAYDNDGNLKQAGSKTLTYDARDEVTNDGTSNYAYKANGTMQSATSSAGTTAYTFDAYGQQATAGTQSFTYDALGRDVRVATSGGSANALSYRGASDLLNSDGSATYTYTPDGTLTGTGTAGASGGGVLNFTDQHTDVTGQFTGVGTSLVGSTAYDPWGTVTSTAGTMTGSLGYQSQYTDRATGQTEMGSRWYSPGTGSFTSKDTVHVNPSPDSAAANTFGYGGDDPMDVTDPSGHCFLGIACGVQSNVAKAVTSGVKTVAKVAAPVVKTAAKVAAPVVKAVVKVAAPVVKAAVTVTYVATVLPVVTAAKVIAHPTQAAAIITDAAKTGVHALAHPVETGGKLVSTAKQKVVSAAKATGNFIKKHASTIVGVAAGIGVFGLCEGASLGLGTVGCAALAGAAGNLVSYGMSCAKAGNCTVAGGLTSALVGGVSGLVGGAAGEFLAGGLGEALSGAVSRALPDFLSDGVSAAVSKGASGAAVGTIAGAAGGAAGGAAQFDATCLQGGDCSWSALGKDVATTSAVGALGGGLGGGLAGAFKGAFGATAPARGSGATDPGSSPDATTAPEARAPAQETTPAKDPVQASCGQSFTAATPVLLASGAAAAISTLKAGDKVSAVNTATGKAETRTVQAVMVKWDTDLYNLSVKAGGHRETIGTTASHLFWDPAGKKWVEASNLKKGEHLKTPDGQNAVADGGTTPKVHDGWMWDLTIEGDHDFYVEPVGNNPSVPGDALVLVHNVNTPLSGTCGPSGEPVFGIPRGSSGGPTAEDRITPKILGDYNIGVNADPAQQTPMCSYCRVNPATSVDHVEARINGGNLEDDNMTPACTFCNSSKRNRIAPVNPPPNYSGPWPPSWWPANMRGTVATPRTVP